MQGENHALVFEFPEHRDRIHHLKQHDSDFQLDAQRYHQLDHHIRGLEMNQIPTSDDVFIAMKKQRAHLKDRLYQKIADSLKGATHAHFVSGSLAIVHAHWHECDTSRNTTNGRNRSSH